MKVYELSFQKNIRDIGGLATSDGHHIKYGRLYRGGALYHINEDDIKVIDSFHLTDIIDFRSLEEFINMPDYLFKGVNIHHCPALRKDENEKQKREVKGADGNLLWFLDDHSSGFEHLRRTYADFVISEEGRKAYKDFFEIISQDNVVSYFHCSQGKDRTGFAAYLLEIALGVSKLDAMDDYLLSNVAMASRAEALLRSVEYKSFYNEEYKQSLIDVFSTKVEYMEAALNAMEDNYGGVLNFIKDGLGVDIERLKELYLE